MPTTASISPISKLEPGVTLLFYSPDEKRAQRLAARLRSLASVHWEDSRIFSPERWAQQQQGQRLVLLDYARDNADASTALAHQLSALTPDIPLLGVGSTAADRATGVLAALRAGVRDFVDMDATDEEIRTLLNHVLQPATPSSKHPAAAPRKRGRLMILLGVRPGVGTSTLAAHLGVLAMPAITAIDAATDTTSPQALLLDLGHPAGDAALYLGLAGDFHYGDALRHADRIDPTLIRTALPHHASHLALLSQAPDAPEPLADNIEASVLIDRLLNISSLLLCDLGGQPCGQIPSSLLRAADEIWLIADQGIASVVSLNSCLRQLEQLQVRDQRLSLIINRHDEECGIGARQIADRFELPLLATLPDRAHALRTCANQGLLLHQTAPRDPYIRALSPLLAKLHTGPQPHDDSPTWKKLIRRAGGFRWKTP
ncbi:AAA family ATPase [Dyella tabacisoli]|uniref:Fimbrial protein n=1 Tax=Dyella tabacisoli TaxID=2282381 RepID=A0A369UNN6_9GAMM|nr:fimbrial protein [Dyella tabacisoli]RDD81328.1 fimbrial protein [Dyella tabacisoli]